MQTHLIHICMAVLFALSGCSDRYDSHIQVPEIDRQDKGGAIVALDVTGVDASKIQDTHIYGFDAQQKMVCHYYYPTPQELSLDMLELESGTYTFVAVLNVGKEFTPTATRAAATAELPLPDVLLSELLSYIKEVEADYPDMLTGMISRQVELGQVAYLEIVIQDNTGGLATSKLQLTLTLPGAEFPAYQSYRTKATVGYTLRGVVEAYLKGGSSPAYHSPVQLTPAADGSYILEAELPAGNYEILVWADYSTATATDLFYNTTNLKAVTFNGSYTAGTQAREMFYKTTVAEMRAGTTTAQNLMLERPMAKYRLVANDLDHYRSLMSTNDYPPPEKLSITIRYEGFLPCGFDVSTGIPNDAAGGYSYNATLPVITGEMTEVEMANDYVLVNGSESAVTVTVLVKDKTGKVISRVLGVQVKYKRGMLTTITGDFLTAGMRNPGINIDTNWDGEYEVTF